MMRTTILILLPAIGLLSVGPVADAGNAGGKSPAKPAKGSGANSKPMPKEIYSCNICRVAKDKPGNCPFCRAKLTKLKAYGCTRCGPAVNSDKPMACPKCKTPMKPTSEIIAEHGRVCEKCNWIIVKGPPCPVCLKMKKPAKASGNARKT